MARKLLLALAFLALAALACGLSSGAPGNALIILLDDDGNPSDELALFDVQGKELRRITTDTPVNILYTLPASQRALAWDFDASWFLIKTDSGEALPLDIPEDVASSISFSLVGFNQQGNKNWWVMGNPRGAPVFLLNQQSGELVELTNSDDVEMTFGGSFSPDGRYLTLLGSSGVRLVAVDDPENARQLGDSTRVFNAEFSADSKQVVYIRRDEDRFEIVLEKTAGGGEEVILESEQLIGRVTFAPDDRHLLVAKDEALTLLTIENGEEEILADFAPGSFPVMLLAYPANRQRALLCMETDNERRWYFIDVAEKSVDEIDALADSMPMMFTRNARWVLFSYGVNYGDPRQYTFLNLETGEADGLSGELEDQGYLGSTFSSDGKLALIYTRQEDTNHLWLADAESGKATLLGDGLRGILSPNGQWVASIRREDDSMTFELLPTSGEAEAIPLGAGFNPIWVNP